MLVHKAKVDQLTEVLRIFGDELAQKQKTPLKKELQGEQATGHQRNASGQIDSAKQKENEEHIKKVCDQLEIKEELKELIVSRVHSGSSKKHELADLGLEQNQIVNDLADFNLEYIVTYRDGSNEKDSNELVIHKN